MSFLTLWRAGVLNQVYDLKLARVIFTILTSFSAISHGLASHGASANIGSDTSTDLVKRKMNSSIFNWTVKDSTRKVYDALIDNGIPQDILKQTFEYFDAHSTEIANQRVMVLVDFSQRLSESRFYVMNLKTAQVLKLPVSHGNGSDPERTGFASIFSDKINSNMSSLGFYKTLKPYTGGFGYSLRLKGLSSTNKNTLKRLIVLHGYPIGSGYNQKECIREQTAAGRAHLAKNCIADGALTQGCFGVPKSAVRTLINEIQGGALIFAYNGKSNG